MHEKECWIVSDEECYSGIVIRPWSDPPIYKYTDGERVFDMCIRFYTFGVLNEIFRIDVGPGMRCRAKLVYLPKGKGFTLKLYGKPSYPNKK